jgi:hypothetical protein
MIRSSLAIALAASAFAIGLAPIEAPAQAANAKSSATPAYTPPTRGAPARRVGGSSRGAAGALPNVMPLVPDHVGLTTSERPILYWYLSKPTSVRVEITLIDDKGETPLIEYAVKDAQGPAVHRIDLAAHGVSLKPGVEYQWSISVVPDPKERSNDVMASGVVKRVDAPAAVASARAKGMDKEALARMLAANGIWYDAIDAYSELITARPNDRGLREQRAALLDQVGLKDVAEFDRSAAK